MSRYDRIMEGAAKCCAFYRANPARFAADYLHLKLKLFQKILLTLMMVSTVFCFIGARGIGKSFMSAVYLVTRCILYPGTKCCIASGTRGQALNVIEKIQTELIPNSPELKAEISEIRINGTEARVLFKNGSYIKVVTASDSSRGNRANVLLLDEFRLLKKDVVDTVLRKFLTQRRMATYSELTEEQRIKEYDKEKNITMYLSSAWWQDSWAFLKCKDTCQFMLDDTKKQFVCGFPYQLSIREGLLDREVVEDEMAETDFSEIKFLMEYCAEFYGSSEGAFFDFDSVAKNRRIKYPMFPGALAQKLNNAQQVRIPAKQNGEVRILSADIALMSSKKHNNDATAIFINQLIPNRLGRYTNNIVYCDAMEGLRTEDQALVIRKMYEEFECDWIVLDTNGIGLGTFDALARDLTDPDTGDVYPALSCYNDKTMADRCTAVGADKVIWSIKANSQFNSDCAALLRDGFRNGKVRLLISEYDAEEALGDIRGYGSLSPAEKMQLQMPYIHTTLLINELVNLQHDESSGKIKIYEKSGMRKDRYSSLAYNYYVATQLESKLVRQSSMSQIDSSNFVIKPPKLTGKVVSRPHGKNGAPGWS